MSTVISIPLNDFEDKDIDKKIQDKVEPKIREIINTLKSTHEKFKDPDFGPSEDDEYGAKSLYGDGPPAPAGTNKYPSPESLRWDRPHYADKVFGADGKEVEVEEEEEEEEEDEFSSSMKTEEVFCTAGELFIGGSSSGDVIQGKLGDCWFLGALAVLGTQQKLIENCFWRKDSFKEFGLYVCIFYKDGALRCVIIDDMIPVFSSNGSIVFARCSDPNELWVPLIEKAYAKLHGCYKALIGGYVHYGLADMTGYSPRLIGLKEGYMGYSVPFEDGQLWGLLKRYQKWGCLMGTSIQSKAGEDHKVEANAGQGLKMGHAYSFLGVGKIKVGGKDIKLVKLRNPWGFGEWTGPWSDSSVEREKYKNEINEAFKAIQGSNESNDVRENDGAFFMTFQDWKQNFTCLFVAIKFPDTWRGKLVTGEWSGDLGGPREMNTWQSNPKIKVKLTKVDGKTERPIFVGLYINDTRLTLGKDYYTDPLYKTALGFDIVKCEDIEKPLTARGEEMPGGQRSIRGGCMYKEAKENEEEEKNSLAKKNEGEKKNSLDEEIDPSIPVPQPPYLFGSSQVELMLETDVEYYIIPSLRKRNQPGNFFLHVFSDGDFALEGGTNANTTIGKKVQDNIKNKALSSTCATTSSSDIPNVSSTVQEKPKSLATEISIELTPSQKAEKEEQFREKLLNDASRLKLSLQDITRSFIEDEELRLFKRKLMDLGFNLVDFPDSDFNVLLDKKGKVSATKFKKFVEDGMALREQPTPPAPPVDDLLFTPIDISGELTVIVKNAKKLRKASAWFSSEVDNEANSSEVVRKGVTARPKLTYDSVAAAKAIEPPIPTIRRSPPTQQAQSQQAGVDTPKKQTGLPNLDTSGSFLAGPKSYGSGLDDLKSVNSVLETKANPVLEKIGLSAGQVLHSDVILQKMEVERARFLAIKREQKKNIEDISINPASNKSGLLILNNMKPSAKKEPRKITNDMLVFLGMAAEELLPTESPRLTMSSSRIMAQAMTPSRNSGTGSPFHVNNRDGVRENTSKRSPDIWDIIIDRVVVLSDGRSKSNKNIFRALTNPRNRLKESFLKTIETPKSNIPSPSLSKGNTNVTVKSKGTIGTPKTAKVVTNSASATAAVRLQSKQKATLVDARDELIRINEEEIQYTEVYRRLISVPIINLAEVDASLGAECIGDSQFLYGSEMTTSFEFFDKDHDGVISFEEFDSSLKQLSVNLPYEDVKNIFKRFDINNDNSIQWKEFLYFFKRKIDTSNTLLDYYQELNSNESLIPILKRIASKHGKNDVITKKYIYNSVFAEMTSLDVSQTKRNAEIISRLGLPISEIMMLRISRAFNYNFVLFLDFLKLLTHHDITVAMGNVVCELLESFAISSGCISTPNNRSVENLPPLSNNSKISRNASAETAALKTRIDIDFSAIENATEDMVAKLYCTMCNNISDLVSYDDVYKHFNRMIRENISSNNKDFNSPTYENFNLDILCRLVVEELVYSPWNKSMSLSKTVITENNNSASDGSSTTAELISTLSFSGLLAFIRFQHTSRIEERLKSIIHLQSYSDIGAVNLLVHCYLPQNNLTMKSGAKMLNTTKKDSTNHLLIVACDPLSSNIFKLKVDIGDINLPIFDNEYILKIFRRYERLGFHADDLERVRNGIRTYNATDTPVEDQCITELLSKLRFVNNQKKNILLLSEDIKFIDTLKTLIEKSKLPFFTIVNEISLTFEVSKSAVEKSGTMQKLVFGNIRKNKTLLHFLSNVISDMRIILRTYDDAVTESMNWEEMLAFLCGNRNPFVTVQLLPQYVEPKCGMIDFLPKVISDKFKLLAEKDKNLKDILHINSEKDDSNDAPEVQVSSIEEDGGTNPSWNASFKMKFKPPSLTNCPVLITDIVKLPIDDIPKYLIIFLRKAKDESIFMTAYDSRSATEYMLFGGPPHWLLPNPKGERSLSTLQAELEEAVRAHESPDAKLEDKLHLGFAITPRVLISVFNHRNKSQQELLGNCQISISSVLSGTGNNVRYSACLMHEKISNNTGKLSLCEAGFLNVELGFQKFSGDDKQEKVGVKTNNTKLSDKAEGKNKKLNDGKKESVSNEVKDSDKNNTLNLMNERLLQEELLKMKAALDAKTKENEKLGKALLDVQNEEKKSSDREENFRTKNKSHSSVEVSPPISTGNSLPELISLVLDTMMSRYKLRGKKDNEKATTSIILRPLTKVFTAYSLESHGLLSAQLIEEAFSDLMFVITSDQSQMLYNYLKVQNINDKNKPSVDSLLRYFESEGNKKYFGIETVSTTSIKPLPEDQKSVGKVNASTENVPSQAELVVVKNQDKVQDSKQSELSVHDDERRNEGKNDESNLNMDVIDWDTYPLPDTMTWERRTDDRGKIYYVNHALRQTQWNHPLAPKKKKKKDVPSKQQDILKSTDDLNIESPVLTIGSEREQFASTNPIPPRSKSAGSKSNNNNRKINSSTK